MNNYKEEIAKLQTQLDELKSKIEKPKFEVGKWYKHKNNGIAFFEDYESGYGTDGLNEWYNGNHLSTLNCGVWTLATPKEVEDALIKEAVKRGLIGLSKVKDCGLSPTNPDNIISNNPNYEFVKVDNELWVKTIKDFNMSIFSEGKWATPIKTKTIDELATSIKDFHYSTSGSLEDNLIKYFSKEENKQEIIETLNNL